MQTSRSLPLPQGSSPGCIPPQGSSPDAAPPCPAQALPPPTPSIPLAPPQASHPASLSHCLASSAAFRRASTSVNTMYPMVCPRPSRRALAV